MIAKIRTIVRNNRRLTVREIAGDLDIRGLIRCNLNRRSAHEMCVREVCAAFPNRLRTSATSHNSP